jgi:hypothetical protein
MITLINWTHILDPKGWPENAAITFRRKRCKIWQRAAAE